MLGLSIVTLCLTLGAEAVPQVHSEARRISVEDAIQIAAQRLPQLRASRARMEASDAVAKSARGRLLPSLRLSDSQAWVQTGVGVSNNFLPGTNLSAFANFPEDIQYNLFSAAVKQPLLGLVHLSHDYAGAEKNADAGVQDLRAAESDALLQLRSNFLRYFEARAVGETALSSQKDLEEQVGVAQTKVNAGALTTADVLRLKVAAANAKQQVIAANGQAAATRAWLLEVLGLGGQPTDDIEFVAPEGLASPAAMPASVRQAREKALATRPELQGLKLRARAADHQATARTWALLPEVSLDASYTHARLETIRGGANGPLNIDSGSIGLSASWAIWEWGTTWYDRESAAARARAAEAEADGMAESVGADVAARHAELASAQSMVDVAVVQVESATEAYRVMQALSSAGSATTTDLLDAQAALMQAKLNLVRSRYEAAIASVALTHAIGAP